MRVEGRKFFKENTEVRRGALFSRQRAHARVHRIAKRLEVCARFSRFVRSIASGHTDVSTRFESIRPFLSQRERSATRLAETRRSFRGYLERFARKGTTRRTKRSIALVVRFHRRSNPRAAFKNFPSFVATYLRLNVFRKSSKLPRVETAASPSDETPFTVNRKTTLRRAFRRKSTI